MVDRRLAAIGFAAAAGVLATGCGRAPAAETGGIRVGAVYPQSGNQAEGTEELNGVRLAARLVNEDGGVAGQKVEVVAEDAPSADQAAAAVDRLLAKGIQMVVGTYGSTQALPASARASERGATYLETGAVADAVTSRGLPGILRTVATGSTLGRNAARWAHDFVIPGLGLKPGAERTVIMFEDDQYGSAVGYGAIDEAAAQGLHVVDTVKYRIGQTDYNQLAARVDADHPDLILTASYLEDAVAFRRATIARHMKVRAIVGTSSAYCRQDFGDTLGVDAVGLFASDKPSADINVGALRPEAQAMWTRATTAYAAAYGKPMSAAALSGFVGGWVLFHEVLPRTGGRTTRADVMAAALRLDLPEGSEINGAGVSFAPDGAADQGQNRRAVGVIWEWVGLKQRAVVYPPAYAKAKPQVISIRN